MSKATILGVLCFALVVKAGEREWELRKVNLRVELAAAVLETAKKAWRDEETLFAAGRTTMPSVEEARLAMAEADADQKRLTLDRMEITATGREPDDGVTAPQVEKTDYVLGRLHVEERITEHRWQVARRILERAKKGLQNGVVSQLDLLEVEADSLGAEAGVKWVIARRKLRQQFLKGELPAERAELLADRMEPAETLDRLKPRLKLLDVRLRETKAAAESGHASAREQREAEIDLLELKTEYELAKIDLERADAALAELGKGEKK